MPKNRLEAFSDGVMAIIITIMVLDLKAPHTSSLAALSLVLPGLFSYLLSFVFVGIYWNNHHHMFQATETVNGTILWANLNLLFWLSLLPIVTDWLSESHVAPLPTAAYGFVLLMAGVAYWLLQTLIIRSQGRNSLLAKAVGADIKGKSSPFIYVVAIAIAGFYPWIAAALYITVALIWLIPDRRIEKRVTTKVSSEERHE